MEVLYGDLAEALDDKDIELYNTYTFNNYVDMHGD